MNEDQARLTRLYQYLLSKDAILKNQCIDTRWKCQKQEYPDEFDIIKYLIAVIKVEFWQEISSDLWTLLK